MAKKKGNQGTIALNRQLKKYRMLLDKEVKTAKRKIVEKERKLRAQIRKNPEKAAAIAAGAGAVLGAIIGAVAARRKFKKK
jgi:ElaB/YqjD/DUF883 family membrane-anchored ribosome-binding protein